MTAALLTKGANTTLIADESDAARRIVVDVEVVSNGSVLSDTSALLLGADGRVRSNDDLIFYNQPNSVDESVQLLPRPDESDVTMSRDSIVIDLSAVPSDVTRIVVCASIDPETSTTFGDACSTTLIARADDKVLAYFPIDGLVTERALILGELYRRGPDWKLRAVGQGYAEGLGPLATEFGIDVDDTEPEGMDAETGEAADRISGDNAASAESSAPEANVQIKRQRRAPRIPADWKDRSTPYLPVPPHSPFHQSRLFPVIGSRATTEQEVRATSILLSTMEIVREFGRSVTAAVGAPAGRLETFIEPAFMFNGSEARPDGLIRITRGSTTWTALVEVKIGTRRLEADQINTYLALAKDKKFDAVITISPDLRPVAGSWGVEPDAKLVKAIALHHISWEEVIAAASMTLHHNGVDDKERGRLLHEYLVYATHSASGLGVFDDMGKNWVHVRDAVKTRTISARDSAPIDVCEHFDRLIRHCALQLTAMLGQRVQAIPPAEQKDAVSRSRQLADSGKLYGTLRTAGVVGPIIVEADLTRDRANCSITVAAPKPGRPLTHVNWLLRQLAGVEPKARVTAHHAGSRETTAVLLVDAQNDPTTLVPSDGRAVREFTVTIERSVGTKRAGSATGFAATITELVNDFYGEVAGTLRPPA